MNGLRIELEGGKKNFSPGDKLRGKVSWDFVAPPMSIEIRLIWFTKGRGTQDAEIVEKRTFEYPGQRETRAFDFVLPVGPYSFSGKLITLIWALELVDEDSSSSAVEEIVVAPYGKEVLLYQQ